MFVYSIIMINYISENFKLKRFNIKKKKRDYIKIKIKFPFLFTKQLLHISINFKYLKIMIVIYK